MSKNIIAIAAVAVIAVGGGACYGGMQYAESRTPIGRADGAFQGFQNLTSEQRQQMGQRFQGNGGSGAVPRGGFAGEMGGAVVGEVISRDEQSITVRLPDGGSKIVFLGESTGVSRMIEGSIGDLVVGEQVVVSGSANDDGSVTARLIQVRPAPPVSN